ncbi:MAG TPA: glycosyltransferase family 39 protein [Rhizomicrobium sp.]|nr:glycosyltransferase family 39 protein [Rhizomicrobium sp.]
MTGAPPQSAGRIAGAIPNAVLALFAFVCAVGLWRVLAVIGLHVPLDPNEGWNAYLAAAAMAGHAYRDAHGYVVNNYPPLSFYLVGAAGRIIGDNIIAGRIVSLLAFACVVAGVFRAACAMKSCTGGALIGTLLFAAWLIVGSEYVGMDDPQLLSHALQIAALLLVLKKSPNDIAAAVLFALALFVKHNLVAMPLAVGLWLLTEDRARARRFIGAGVAFFLLEIVLFRLVYGSNLLGHLASARAYSFALLAGNVGNWLVWGTVPLLIALGLVAFRPKDRFVFLAALYAAIAVAVGVAFSGGAGVDANAFFDADIALSLCAALAFNRIGTRGDQWQAAVAASLLLPLGLGLYQASAGEDWRDPDFWLHPMADETAAARRDIAFIRARPGPALCEMLSFCYWAGKPAEVDVFNTGQQFAAGHRSDADLIRRIDTHDFSVMEFDTLEPFALGVGVKAAVLKAYRIDHTDDDGVFLVPR